MIPVLLAGERFELDLLDSGRSHEVTLDKRVAKELLASCHNKRRQMEYKAARNEALEDALIIGIITGGEWEAYKDFLDRRFQRRAREAIKRKHRPFAPLEAYEDGR